MPKFDVNSNAYTFGYAIVLTLLVASALASVATGLKPMQDREIALDKKKQILGAVSAIEDKTKVEGEYAKRITELVIDAQGKEVSDANAFDIEIKKEFKKSESDRNMPMYIYAGDDGKKNYIIPLHGAGLWDEIWGYVAIDEDFNTLNGASFGHKGETPGLGAEMTTAWFQDQFKGKQLADQSGSYQLKVLKGKGNDIAGKPHAVDGMSGATITGDGVQDMLEKGYNSYQSYFASLKKQPKS